MVFENRVLRRIFGPKRDEVTWEWRKIHNEQLNNLYYLPKFVRVIENEVGGACSAYGEGRGVYWVLVGKPKRTRQDPGEDGRIILRWIFRT